MLEKDVDKWGIELTLEIPQIEWCFQFKKWKDLDNVKCVHVMNLKAYKDDSQQVVVFLSIPFLMLQARLCVLFQKWMTTCTQGVLRKEGSRVQIKFPNITT